MNIPDLFANLSFSKKKNIRSGTLLAKSETLTSAVEVLERLATFDGSGWYCGTDDEEIRILSKDSLPSGEKSYPICAELVDGDQSLHLSRSETGWEIALLKRAESEQEDSVLVENQLLARKNRGYLRYEVLWSPQKVGSQIELRPQLYRFLGFTNQA